MVEMGVSKERRQSKRRCRSVSPNRKNASLPAAFTDDLDCEEPPELVLSLKIEQRWSTSGLSDSSQWLLHTYRGTKAMNTGIKEFGQFDRQVIISWTPINLADEVENPIRVDLLLLVKSRKDGLPV